MTTDYQMSLLCYLVQFPDGASYINDLDEELFDLLEFKLTIQTLKKYKKLYGVLPGKVSAQQYLEEQIAETPDLTGDVARDLREVFEDLYVPLPINDKVKLQDTLILEVQQKNIETSFLDFAAGKLSVNQVFTKINKLSSMVKTVGYDSHADGGFLVADREKHYDEQVQGKPTFIHDLNMLTAARGFYAPQLVIFMSGPKSFKTGLLINLAIEYAREGFNVYYADGENGARSIRNRSKQCLMNCTYEELYNHDIQTELNEVLYRFNLYMGGDLFIDSYPANTKSMGDVRSRLAYLKEEHNWKPDIIFYDSIDHFIPTNQADQKRDTRIKIQLVYHEAINLNRELGTFAIAPSQVNRDALSKRTFDMKDLSEDFGKAMNAHAIFAICGDPKEVEEGIRRIIPVAQREGVGYKGKNLCYIEIDEERMQVRPVNKEKYLENLKDD
jgi:KaiC/GvpD/RAD55 family RecA-like ATPase